MALFLIADLFYTFHYNDNNVFGFFLLNISYFHTILYQDIALNYTPDNLYFRNTNSTQAHILQFLIPVS